MSELALPDHRRPIAATRASDSGHVVRPERQRTCVGCRRGCARADLVRLIAAADGKIVFDLRGGAWGRGAWVHPRPECVSRSVRGLARALRQPIRVTTSELHERLVMAAWRRLGQLLVAAQRSGQLRVDPVEIGQCWTERTLALLLVARDAREAMTPEWVAEAVVQGRVLVTPSRVAMGEWLGTQEVDLAAITESVLATAIARNVAIAETFAPAPTAGDPTKVRRLDEQQAASL
jgi:predicted RNA-binding protein YlxR (DUF448 family)